MTLHVITSSSVFWDHPHRNLIRRSVESRKGRIVCSFETISRQESSEILSKHIPSPSGTKNPFYEINYDDGVADLHCKLDIVVTYALYTRNIIY